MDPERLRKWESRYGLLEPERSAGGFRIYSPEDEQRVRLMQRHLTRGYAAAEAAEMARQGIVAPAPARLRARMSQAVVERSRALFRQALVDFDEGAAQRALDDLFGAFGIDSVLRDALLPFMREVGEEWEGGRLTPAQEHFASTVVEGRLMEIARGWGSGSGPRALLACPSGERHTIGLVAFGIALSRRRWRITYLGADTPADSIASAAKATDPRLIVLAVTAVSDAGAAVSEFQALAADYRVAVGGRGATRALAESVGARHLDTDPVSAAARLARA